MANVGQVIIYSIVTILSTPQPTHNAPPFTSLVCDDAKSQLVENTGTTVIVAAVRVLLGQPPVWPILSA